MMSQRPFSIVPTGRKGDLSVSEPSDKVAGLISNAPTGQKRINLWQLVCNNDRTALGLDKAGERADEQGVIRIVELDSLLPLYAGLKNEDYY